MSGFFRKLTWWARRRRKEDELQEELQFHLANEAEERRAGGLTADEAQRAARRDLGNVARLQEETRTLWTWTVLEQLAQDLRYALRMMVKHRTFTALAALSLALGIGANTAIYSFMDAILMRSLAVPDPASLVVVKWHSRPFGVGARATNGPEFVLHSGDGEFYDDRGGVTGAIFPFPAFALLQQASAPVLSGLFAYKAAGNVNVIIRGEAELAAGEYVSGGFFGGLAVSPAAGRVIVADDDRAGSAPVAVISLGYSQRRFGDAASAIGQSMLINNLAFTIVGVAPAGFVGVDPARAPHVYLPLHARILFTQDGEPAVTDQNYYWLEMMGRLRPGVDLAQAQAVLAAPFGQWAATTATNDRERANLPALYLDQGAGGLDSLRRRYTKPLYVLLAMVGLILAIACANTANLLLARASARRREIAVRLSIGAGRWRVVRQLLTESVLLASVAGVLGIVIAVAGIGVLTQLLANGQDGFTLHATVNWRVLGVTLGLSLLCGMLFGLAPAIQTTRASLVPALKDRSVGDTRVSRRGLPRLGLSQTLVVAQIAISLLLLVAAGLFVRTLANLQGMPLGFNRDHVLLFEVNAPQAGYPEARTAAFYGDLLRRLSEVPGVREVTLSHASLIRAGRSHPVTINGVAAARGTRLLFTGPRFLTTMQIPMVRGREIADSDREGALPVVVVSELFAKTHFGGENPIGRHLEIGGSLRVSGVPLVFEIVGVAATIRYGGLKYEIPPVVYVPYAQVPAPQQRQATFALRTDGDPLRYAPAVRQIVHEADGRVPVTNLKTQAADIDQTINQEIVFARLCTAFAVLALVIACVGLYATMAYAVARRTSELGLRMALGARRGVVIWMVLREVCILAVVGLAIGVPTALASSRVVASFLFETKPNDPRAIALAAVVLLSAALVAGYGPARRASRVDPLIALRHE